MQKNNLTAGVYLFLDAHGHGRSTVGILEISAAGKLQWLALNAVNAPAMGAIFEGAAKALEQAGVAFENLTAFVYNAGPGSVLGLRCAAMAVSTWRAMPALAAKPALTFNTFYAAAALHAAQHSQGSSAPLPTFIMPTRSKHFGVYTPPETHIHEWDEAQTLAYIEAGKPYVFLHGKPGALALETLQAANIFNWPWHAHPDVLASLPLEAINS